jgi:tetratricopeptide (TPR) repeat protein
MIKMKKNLSLFLILLAVVLLAAAGTGCSAKAKKIYHLQRAAKFYAANDYTRAEIEYLNVLRNDPLNAEAIGKLGSIYFDEGRIQRAAPFVAKGSELATNDLSLRLKLGYIYSAMGRISDAQAQANFILSRQPQNEEAPLLLAEASLTHTDIEAAQRRLQALARGGDRAALELALGSLALRGHDVAAAAAAFQRAQTLDARSPAVYSALASLNWAKNDLAAAAANFKQAADLSPPRSPRQMQYARFVIQTGDLATGQKILDGMIKKTPDYVPALMGLAEIAASQTNFTESARQLQFVLARDPDNFEALLFDGRLKLAQGQTDAAVVELERLTRLYPQVAPAHYQLATAYFAQAENVKAINSLSRALELDANYTEAILLMAEAQIKNQNPNPAIVSLERLTEKQPQLVQAQLLLADAYRQAGRPDRAMAIYQPLEKSFPQNPQLPLLIGSAFLEQTNYPQARQEFERLRALQPDNLQALEQLVNLDLAEKNFPAAQRRVQTELDQKPNVDDLRLLLAKVFSTAGNFSQAEATLLKTLELSPENQGAYLVLAQLYVDAKQNAKALDKLNTVLAKNPKNIPALMLAANIQSDNQDYKKAAAVYEQLLQADPKFSPALNNLAYLYSENLGQLDRAYELAKQARELLPYDPNTADTLGWICFQRGTYPTALGLLQESAAKLPAEPEIQLHLGLANYMLGNEAAARAALQYARQSSQVFPDKDEADRCLALLAINPQTADAATQTLLEKRVAEKTDDQIALGRLAAIYQRAGNFEKAAAAYEKVLQANPQNLPAMLNLIQIYSRTDVAKAYQMAKDAYKSAPNNPEASHLLGRLAYQSGDFKLAVNLLQQTTQNQADNGPVWFDFAQAAYSVGRVTDAQAALQSASQLNLPAAQMAEARRMSDLINLANDPAQAAAASGRVTEILKAEPGYVPALMAQAVGNERQANLPAAEAAYEKILDRHPDFSPVQRQLAILYSREPAKASRAATLAIKARETFPTDPALTKALGLIWLQQGDAAHAAKQLADAAAMDGTDAETYFYLGTAQFQLKNRAACKAALLQALALQLAPAQAAAAHQMLDKLK